MGNNNVIPLNIWVVGSKGVGKTHFIDFIVHGGDTTKYPTDGFHNGSYMHKWHRMDFREFGNGHEYFNTFKRAITSASTSTSASSIPLPECIYWIIGRNQTLEELYLDRNLLLKFYQLAPKDGGGDTSVPIIIIMHVDPPSATATTNIDVWGKISDQASKMDEEARGKKTESTKLENLKSTLRLEGLTQHLLIAELSYEDRTSVERILDWTIENTNSTSTTTSTTTPNNTLLGTSTRKKPVPELLSEKDY